MITQAEEKLHELSKEIEELKKEKRLKDDVAYVKLASIIKTVLILWFATIALFVGGIVWYFSQYEIEITDEVTEETITEVVAEYGHATYIEGEGNGVTNGSYN